MDKFQHVRVGTLVKRSAHWMKNHPAWDPNQLGIVTELETYLTGKGIRTWPWVHWEGTGMASLTHPDNCDLVSKVVVE